MDFSEAYGDIMKSLLNKSKKISLQGKMSSPGSLTTETALVLPVFLFAMISVMYLTEAVRFSSEMSAVLSETAEEYAKYAYAVEAAGNGAGIVIPDSIGLIGGRLLGAAAAGAQVREQLGSTYIEESPVEGGAAGISFLRSSVMGNDDMIDLIASYRIDPPYEFLGIIRPVVTDRARVRAFTGYDNTHTGGNDSPAEEYVYITENGSVYHRSRSCRHLNFTVRARDISVIGNERANDGSRYYPCERCAGGVRSGLVYLTDDGNRYHTSLRCPSLTRNIREIPISQAGGRSPCRDCSR